MYSALYAMVRCPSLRPSVCPSQAAVLSDRLNVSEVTMDQGSWVMGHGSNGSTNLDGSRGSWVSTCDPLTYDPLTDDEVRWK